MQITRKEERLKEEKDIKIGESKRGNSKKGMQLGKYELGRTLGEGNFGKVKLAKDAGSGKLFAVKIIEKSKTIDHKVTDQVTFPYPTLFFSQFLYLPLVCTPPSTFLWFRFVFGF